MVILIIFVGYIYIVSSLESERDRIEHRNFQILNDSRVRELRDNIHSDLERYYFRDSSTPE